MSAKIPSSATIPPHLLKTAYLVGKVPFRASKLDPRASYGLYIPAQQYCDFQRALQAGVDTSSRRLPLIVNVHGTRHDASPHRDALVEFADHHGVAILAPFFPAALDHPLDLDSYKVLRSKTLKSDLVLLSMIDEISQLWPGINTARFCLMGFSGGGQFSHRFMYIHPERLSAVVVGAPGRTTRLGEEPWPRGTGNVSEVFDGRNVDLAAMKRIGSILLIVGDQDNDMAAILELKEWLVKQKQGGNDIGLAGPSAKEDWQYSRVQTLQNLHAQWLDHGLKCELTTVPDAGHDHLKVLPVILQWLSEHFEELRGRS